jgi:chromosome segregation ATPase
MEKQLDYIRNRGQFSTEDVKKIQEEAKKQRSDDFLETLLEESKKATEIKEKYDVLVDEMKALDAQYEAGEISMEELQTHADRIADKIDNMKAEDRQGAGVDLGVFFGE